jgi:hypothetical protein
LGPKFGFDLESLFAAFCELDLQILAEVFRQHSAQCAEHSRIIVDAKNDADISHARVA